MSTWKDIHGRPTISKTSKFHLEDDGKIDRKGYRFYYI